MVGAARGEADDIATTFEKIMFNKWVGEKKSAGDVFNYIAGRKKEGIFFSEKMNMWLSYVKKVGQEEDPYKTMFLVLQKHFPGEKELNSKIHAIADDNIVSKLVEQIWLSEEARPDYLFRQLGLRDSPLGLFKQPNFPRWSSYVTKLDPKNADDVMLAIIRPRYSNKQLAKMLAAAQQVPGTKEVATRLERLLARSKGK
ncbi:RxLR effector protein [Phytophthora cinnamomi]|uniref:RxLR effector protein n=1 Tax=Phytophthora cinnamomi TaxID=4785 RepID=UPI00355A0C8D|nr:RxLR effector protein [Phytophthora cinnamomi]